MPNFKPYPYAFIQGQIVPTENATISVMTNALHYGGGIYGGLKAYDTPLGIGLFRIQDHIKRMSESCKILRFPYTCNIEAICEQIITLAAKNKIKDKTYIRPLLYRSDTQLSPDISGDYDLAIYMMDMAAGYLTATNGLSVCVSSWVRNSDNALPPRTKATGGYLNSALAIDEARQNGYDSAIMLNDRGQVCEGAVMNIFIVKDGCLITPGLNADILEGITRRTIIELAQELNIEVIERSMSRSELYSADEVFFSGTALEISWCRAIDKVMVSKSQGPVTATLAKAYANLSVTHPELYTLIARD